MCTLRQNSGRPVTHALNRNQEKEYWIWGGDLGGIQVRFEKIIAGIHYKRED